MVSVRVSRYGWTLFAALLAACWEPAAPRGTPGSVTVQAYIDRDASGTLTASDSALAGMSISLLPGLGGSEVASATTDASGRATFEPLDPGSYVVQPAGSISGAVLTSSPAVTVVIAFSGGADTVDVRFAFFPGSVTGRIFRDDNTNGSYDAGVDTPGAGLYVLLKKGATTVDSTTADANGAYTFARIAPGDYTLVFEKPTTIDYGVSGASRSITVAPQATLTTNGIFTGSLVIPIATARARTTGSGVTVVGKLTVAPNTFTSGSGGVNSEIWVQDATGGIAVFTVPSTSTLALGDSVEVSGTLGSFTGQEQIASSPRVRFIVAGTPVTPKTITLVQAKALGANEGLLVSVPEVRIVDVPTGTGAAFTVRGVNAANDTLQIRVVGTATGLSRSSFTVGSAYTITGILSEFNGTAQLKPRAPGDVRGPITIASARAVPNGTPVSVTGNITVPPNILTSGSGGVNSEIWVQDVTGGIAVFTVLSSSTLALGDLVDVSGTISLFSGQRQISTPTVTFRAAGAAPARVAVTGTQFNALTNEGQLVQLRVTITSVPAGTGASFTVVGTAADGQTVQIRVGAANTGLTRSSFTVGSTYTVTGVLTQFNGTAQVKPRFATDVTP